jgi:glycosyltransferase involved in cell wall biosynthesis
MTPTVELALPHRAWLEEFRRRHGRAPRVLHIGNIANNAYLNGKLLNRAGVDCDVVCPDYYHIMSCPEWEDGDFDGDVEDQSFPAWENVSLNGFERPAWFAQGPAPACLAYLDARRTRPADAARSWQSLTQQRVQTCRRLRRPPARRLLSHVPGARAVHHLADRVVGRLRRMFRPREDVTQVLTQLQALFAATFPRRQDRLEAADVIDLLRVRSAWGAVLAHYDAVIGYATDGIYPLLAGRRPYFAYEHGTIRNIPFEATAQGRLCALTYRLADGCFITNCDNVVAAERLGLARYRFVPHPVNEEVAAAADAGRRIRERLGYSFLVFHPSRQHWEARRHPDWEKGNDILIEGLARFLRDVCPTGGAVFVEWGRTVEASRALLARLGVAARVHWIPPQPNPRMVQYIHACDVLADQFFLGAFGSTMPKALLHGRPAMLYLDEERHRWCFPEMPPVVNARTPDEVYHGLRQLHADPAHAAALASRGREWYHRYHSNAVILGTFLDALCDALGRSAGPVRAAG